MAKQAIKSDTVAYLPPQSLELEESILGVLLNYKEAYLEVSEHLSTPEIFYNQAHAEIFRSIKILHDQAKKVDILTVQEDLKRREKLDEIGGFARLLDIDRHMTTPFNIEYHALVIKDYWIQREVIRISHERISAAYEPSCDALELLDNTMADFMQLQMGISMGRETTLEEAIMERLQQYEEMVKIDITGVPSGFKELDQKTGGFQDGDLVIIAARPSMGKTAELLTMIRNIAINYQMPVGVWSLEMPKGQLIDRLISMEAEVELWKIRTPKTLRSDEYSAMVHVSGKLAGKNNIYIDDSASLTINQFRAKARRMKLKYGIRIAFIDYLQLMSGTKKGGNREQEISEISRGLKQVAKDLKIPVIALAQLGRKSEERPGKKPLLSDLRESGAIEQDADMVILLHRPEYYGITEDESGYPTEGIAENIIAKNRNGQTGSVKMRFIAKYTCFKDLEEDWNKQPEQVPGLNKPHSFVIKPSSRFTDDEDVPF